MATHLLSRRPQHHHEREHERDRRRSVRCVCQSHGLDRRDGDEGSGRGARASITDRVHRGDHRQLWQVRRAHEDASAAERAWVKSRKEYLESRLFAELHTRGFKASFISEEPNIIPYGKISGKDYTALVEYSEKVKFDQDTLRKIDVEATATGLASMLSPPPGLAVKYTASPEKAVTDEFRDELNEAITGYQYDRKVSFIKNAEAE